MKQTLDKLVDLSILSKVCYSVSAKLLLYLYIFFDEVIGMAVVRFSLWHTYKIVDAVRDYAARLAVSRHVCHSCSIVLPAYIRA